MRISPRRLRTAIAVTAAAVTVAALGACSSDESGGGSGATGGGDGLTTLKVATIGLLSDGGLQTGIAQGFFEEEGLQIETSIVANPPAGLAAAQSGQVDIAYSPSIPLLNALSQGIELNVVAGADGFSPGVVDSDDPADLDDTGLFASPSSGITSIADLGGKTIAVPARSAQLEVTIANSLQEAGVDPSTINWVVLDFTSAVTALESGNVDAAGLVAPFTSQAETAGATWLAAPALEFFGEAAVGLWTAGASTVADKSDAIAAFQRAIHKANEYANANQEEAIQAGIDYTESTLTVDEVTIPYWPTAVAETDLSNVNDKLVALGYLDAPVDLTGVILEGA